MPEARGQAARIVQEAEAYREATIALAEGEALRFTQVLEEYRKAPEITRKRLYLQTMESVLGRSKKVLLDAENSGNVLYLPLDQLTGTPSSSSKNMPPVVTPDPNSQREINPAGRNARREGRQ